MPWLRLWLAHCLPASLMVALAHQALKCPWREASISPGVLCVDVFLLLAACRNMYKHALCIWEQRPPPSWDGAPIYWQAGPEHAAACLSNWLRHVRWFLKYTCRHAPLVQRFILRRPKVAAASFGTAGMLQQLACKANACQVCETSLVLHVYSCCWLMSQCNQQNAIQPNTAEALLLDTQFLATARKLQLLIAGTPEPPPASTRPPLDTIHEEAPAMPATAPPHTPKQAAVNNTSTMLAGKVTSFSFAPGCSMLPLQPLCSTKNLEVVLM